MLTEENDRKFDVSLGLLVSVISTKASKFFHNDQLQPDDEFNGSSSLVSLVCTACVTVC